MKTAGVCVKTLVLCGGRSANRMTAAAAPAMAPVPRPPPAPGRRRPRHRPRPPRADTLSPEPPPSASPPLTPEPHGPPCSNSAPAGTIRPPPASLVQQQPITRRLPGPRQFSADKIFFFLMGV
jgi:hypothetical protein